MPETDEVIYNRYLSEQKEDDIRVLLERHRESLTLFLMSIVNNPEDAEDLMLDAFAEVAAGGGFHGRSSFKTWLFSIGKNKAYTFLRKRHFLLSPIEEQADIEAKPPELDILLEERNRSLYEALTRLKEEYRQILILLYFEGMSYEEAGKVMKKSRKQVYNLAERGKKNLKEELERMGFDYAEY